MAVAKNPGAGQGVGGGRPRRGPVVRMRLDLTPDTAAVLEAQAEATGQPIWKVVDALVATEGGKAALVSPADPPEHLAEALQIAGEIAAFLDSQEDRRAALKTLQRAWSQAFALARHQTSMAADPAENGERKEKK